MTPHVFQNKNEMDSWIIRYLMLSAAVLAVANCELCRDHAGKEFVIVYFPLSASRDHFLQAHVRSAYKRLVNARIDTPLLSGADRVYSEFNVSPNHNLVINIINLHQLPENVKNPNALVVSANDDIMIYACTGKPGSVATYLVYPTNFLGLQYCIITYQPTAGSDDRALVSIVAVYDNTKITITFASNPDLHVIINGTTYTASDTYEFYLLRYETFLLSSTEDLTGTCIEGSKPIAVFSGNSDVKIDPGDQYADHIMEQFPPNHVWGTDFLISLYPKQQTFDIVRILNPSTQTEISINVDSEPTYNITLSENVTYFNVSFQSNIRFHTSLPVMAAHFGSGNQNADGYNTSSTMAIVQPVNNYHEKYYLIIPVFNISLDYKHFVVIVMDENVIPYVTLRGLGGLDAYAWNDFQGTNYKYRHFEILAGSSVYTVESNNGMFGGYLFGFAEEETYSAPLSVLFDEKTWQRNNVIYTTKFNFVTKDKLPYMDPILEVQTRSSLDCHKACLNNAKCGVVATYKTTNYTICKLYEYEERCDPLMTYVGYKMYARVVAA